MQDGLVRFVVMAVLMVMAGTLALSILIELGPLLVLLAGAAAVYWALSHATRVATGPDAPSRAARHRFHRMMGQSPRAQPFTAPARPDPSTWVREARSIAGQIRQMVRRGDRPMREALATVPASAQKLADHVAELARSYAQLEQYLAHNSAAESQQRAAEMARRAEQATDSFVRDQYEAAAESLRAQAQVCADLAQARERLNAEVERILATLVSLRSRIMAARSGVGADGTIGTAAGELSDLQAQVDNFSASVRQVINQASRGAR